MPTAQVRITNASQRKDGVLVPKVLSIKASSLPDYIRQLLGESNKVYTPNRSKEFEHLPVLSVWDIVDTGEEYLFKTMDDLPKKTVFNSQGAPILIILPEEADVAAGTNINTYLTKDEKDKMRKQFKEARKSRLVLKPEKNAKK